VYDNRENIRVAEEKKLTGIDTAVLVARKNPGSLAVVGVLVKGEKGPGCDHAHRNQRNTASGGPRASGMAVSHAATRTSITITHTHAHCDYPARLKKRRMSDVALATSSCASPCPSRFNLEWSFLVSFW